MAGDQAGDQEGGQAGDQEGDQEGFGSGVRRCELHMLRDLRGLLLFRLSHPAPCNKPPIHTTRTRATAAGPIHTTRTRATAAGPIHTTRTRATTAATPRRRYTSPPALTDCCNLPTKTPSKVTTFCQHIKPNHMFFIRMSTPLS